jgi:geranylgeranyl pyrophosphate synthase
VGDDLSEGKTTLPIIYALKNTTAKDRQLLEDAINNADNSKIKHRPLISFHLNNRDANCSTHD